MSVKEKLDYLDETKSILRTTINNLGGGLSTSASFDEYPDAITKVINKNVIPQSELNALVEKAIAISGEDISN